VSKSMMLHGLMLGGFCLYAGSQAISQTARAVLPTGRIVTAEASALTTSADLIVKDVGLGGLGQIVFTLENRGGVSINAPRRAMPSQSISTPPIKIDLYVGGSLVQSVYESGLNANASKVVTVPQGGTPPRCGETRALKIVVDPGNVVPELHDDNNSAQATAPRPCPDLAVQSITKVSTGVAGETYSVKVTVINKGMAASPPADVWGTSMTTAPGLNGWPETVPMHQIPALAPGETTSFRIGGSVVTGASSWVRVFLDINRLIDESDETNNLVDKKL
jgi:hypothetical protein